MLSKDEIKEALEMWIVPNTAAYLVNGWIDIALEISITNLEIDKINS